MPVDATTETSVTLDVGDVWEIGVLVTDDDGDPAAATVAVQVTTPSGTTAAPTATTDETGYYDASYTLLAAGRHLAVVTVSGTVVGVEPFTALAQSPTTAAGTPTLADVIAYLGEDTSHTAQEVQDALDAETAAQARRCRIPAVYPEDLAQALKRRVARNLAARSVPVASFTSFEGGGTVTRVPRWDAEIVRLEGPYRRRQVG